MDIGGYPLGKAGRCVEKQEPVAGDMTRRRKTASTGPSRRIDQSCLVAPGSCRGISYQLHVSVEKSTGPLVQRSGSFMRVPLLRRRAMRQL